MCAFDPNIHHRRSIRLQDYDYRDSGAYFITICTFGRESSLASIGDGEIILFPFGRIVEQCWLELPKRFSNVSLDAFVIMPNHLHGIIVIESEGRGKASAHQRCTQTLNPGAGALPKTFRPRSISGSLASIIQAFKSTASRRIRRAQNNEGAPFWQRNYYEHVIRNEKSLDEIREYIESNPWNWHLDEYLPLEG